MLSNCTAGHTAQMAHVGATQPMESSFPFARMQHLHMGCECMVRTACGGALAAQLQYTACASSVCDPTYSLGSSQIPPPAAP